MKLSLKILKLGNSQSQKLLSLVDSKTY